MQKEPREPLPWNTPAHDAALYPTLKWHLYLPKLSFDSLPHTAPQITFNTDIKSCSKICLGRLEGRVQGMVGGGIFIFCSICYCLRPGFLLLRQKSIFFSLKKKKENKSRFIARINFLFKFDFFFSKAVHQKIG